MTAVAENRSFTKCLLYDRNRSIPAGHVSRKRSVPLPKSSLSNTVTHLRVDFCWSQSPNSDTARQFKSRLRHFNTSSRHHVTPHHVTPYQSFFSIPLLLNTFFSTPPLRGALDGYLRGTLHQSLDFHPSSFTVHQPLAGGPDRASQAAAPE